MKDRSKIMVKLGVKAARSRAFRASDDFMDEFIETLTSLGGIYAKFLQGVLLGYMASKGKKMSGGQLDIFEDNPDPGFSESDIARALGPLSTRIVLTDTKPLGVGSYSAVYSALLDGTEQVVVKILRPNIHDEITHDLSFLRKLTYVFKLANIKIIAVDITQFYSAFKKACLKETDFPAEIAFASHMYERYKNHQTIVVPKTYVELSNDHVIIQERIGGVSAKTFVEAKLNDDVDVSEITSSHLSTNIHHVMGELVYEMYHSFLSELPFHGDLHPGNVRILRDNKIGILDFGIKADSYSTYLVPAAVNKLESDALFIQGDFDLVRILDAHFRLYMAKLYSSIDSVLTYYKHDVNEFFQIFVSSLGVSIDSVPAEKRQEWQKNGPASMLNELLNGSERFGLEVKVSDHSTHRAINTMLSLLKALGIRNEMDLPSVYRRLSADIQAERSELFQSKKLVLPDIALENVYIWIEQLVSKNPELANSLRKALNDGLTRTSTTAS